MTTPSKASQRMIPADEPSGREVTAAMKAEGVPEVWLERADLAMATICNARENKADHDGYECSCADDEMLAAALAAVAPLVAARVVADEQISFFDRFKATGSISTSVIRKWWHERAARLTATTEPPIVWQGDGVRAIASDLVAVDEENDDA